MQMIRSSKTVNVASFLKCGSKQQPSLHQLACQQITRTDSLFSSANCFRPQLHKGRYFEEGYTGTITTQNPLAYRNMAFLDEFIGCKFVVDKALHSFCLLISMEPTKLQLIVLGLRYEHFNMSIAENF